MVQPSHSGPLTLAALGRRLLGVVSLAAVALGGYPGTPRIDAAQAASPGPGPVSLTVTTTPQVLAVGDELVIDYVLRNSSDRRVVICPDSWNTHLFIGTARTGGSGSTVLHYSSDIVTLPPHSAVTWRTRRHVPDLGAGTATLLVTISSKCNPSISDQWIPPMHSSVQFTIEE